MGTRIYENEVEIQSSISVGFTATYNHIPKSNWRYPLTPRFLSFSPPLFPSDRRKIRLDSRVNSSPRIIPQLSRAQALKTLAIILFYSIPSRDGEDRFQRAWLSSNRSNPWRIAVQVRSEKGGSRAIRLRRRLSLLSEARSRLARVSGSKKRYGRD